MPDWTKSMQQTFEYYTVDPNSWKNIKRVDNVIASSIDWDSEVSTLGSATIDIGDTIGETYIRVYLVTIQNGVTEKFPLGTFLIQTLPQSFDGKTKTVSVDAYTPLIELKEKYPPIGYFLPKTKTNIMQVAHALTRENLRGTPVVDVSSDETLETDYVADPSDNWLTFLTTLIANAKYEFRLDEMGRVLFMPKQKIEALQPVWTFDDGNSSILYPEVKMSRDLYGIPNVVEIITSDGTKPITYTAKNEDLNSPTSIQNRGREIVYRETNPKISGVATYDRVKDYAEELLKELSSLENTLTYTHGYCPVRVGDCVRLNYSKLGLNNVKAKVISQNIKCEPGCPVTETAVFTTKLWG